MLPCVDEDAGADLFVDALLVCVLVVDRVGVACFVDLEAVVGPEGVVVVE